MDNNMAAASTLTIDLNSSPIQNRAESPKLGFEDTRVGERESLLKDDEVGGLIHELTRIKSENRKLTEMLTLLSRNLYDLKQVKLQSEDVLSRTRKRKAAVDDDEENPENYSSSKPKVIKSNVSRVHVRMDPCDVSLVVKDGYQWRKYGQKVTRDNPSPRAYYKCYFAPTCPVKKKVQRSLDDPSLLVATYEGRHHHHPLQSESRAAAGEASSTTCLRSSGECSQQLLVEKMASSLTRNHGFTTALAAAITARIFDELVFENNGDHINNIS